MSPEKERVSHWSQQFQVQETDSTIAWTTDRVMWQGSEWPPRIGSNPQQTASKWGPQSYNCKEPNFANNLNWLGSWFVLRASRQKLWIAITLISGWKAGEQRTQSCRAWISDSTLWANGCVLCKPLCVWWLAAQHRKPITQDTSELTYRKPYCIVSVPSPHSSKQSRHCCMETHIYLLLLTEHAFPQHYVNQLALIRRCWIRRL